MAATKSPRRTRTDLQGIRARGGTFQVRVFGGTDPVSGKQVILTGSAPTKEEAVRLRNRFRNEVSENKSARTNATLAHLLATWLDRHDAEPETVDDYRFLAETFIVPALGDVKLIKLARLGPHMIEQFYAELRRCRRRCNGKPFVEHRKGCKLGVAPDCKCDNRCKAHACRPLGGSTLRHIHVVLNGSLKAAVRWGWIGVNPIDGVAQPRAPRPDPTPPSAAEAARIIDKAWSMDDDWGTFVWLTMVTGARRGELVGLRFNRVELACNSCGSHLTWTEEQCPACDTELTGNRVATLLYRRNYSARRKQEKDTKTHQIRRIALDPTTTEILAAQRRRYEQRMGVLGGIPKADTYIFSYAPDHSRPCSPDGLTHKYARMTEKLGLDTTIHDLRHYSATELLAAGVDLRTVAGRLGHGSGGVTTLRVYAAWVRSADEQAAALLASRLPGTPPSFRSSD